MKKGIILLLVLCVLLTGCEGREYEQAMALYEAGDYAAASAIFTELADYEDSAAMVTACAYGQAMDAFEAGDFEQAKAAFEALGGYQDSTAMITACRYALAEALFAAGDFRAAQLAFEALGDYQDAAGLAADARWLSIGQYIRRYGQTGEDGVTSVSVAAGAVTVHLAADGPEGLILWAEQTQDLGFLTTRELCQVSLKRERAQADYILSTDTKSYADGLEGFTQITAGGSIPLAELGPDTVLPPEDFSGYARDVYGTEYTWQTPGVTDLVAAQGLLAVLLEQVPALLEQTGTGYTLPELGFQNAQ